jgi:hypothetical protein
VTKITTIEIKNIKGIGHKTLIVELFPNKPAIFVAPNGFGKSSIACAFSSLNTQRINLDESHYHNGVATNQPEIIIEADSVRYTATSTTSNISSKFDFFVIKNHVVAKAKNRNIGGRLTSSPYLEVSPVVLVDSVPKQQTFNYSLSQNKIDFGVNGKILPNLQPLLDDLGFLEKFSDEISWRDFSKARVYKNPVSGFLLQIKSQTGSANAIKNWIGTNLTASFQSVAALQNLASLIVRVKGVSAVDSYLLAMQLAELTETHNFSDALDYRLYLNDKNAFNGMIASFNTTRHPVRVKEITKGVKTSLVISFPKANDVSNGQRDILSFVAQIYRARKRLKKENCILIIDEIFDYFDDANLIVFQYYIKNIIEEFKSNNRKIFPIVLTHLDPDHFKHFCFNRHKLQVRYLNKNTTLPASVFLGLVKNRDEGAIKDKVSAHHFHYNPIEEDLESEFLALGLRRSWGKSHNFYSIVHQQAHEYLNDRAYDPIAVLLSVRIKIENLAWDKLGTPVCEAEFLSKYKTVDKLDYCSELGIEIPESHYLLGIIYNDALHWKPQKDYETPLRSKLDNVGIKNIIAELY